MSGKPEGLDAVVASLRPMMEAYLHRIAEGTRVETHGIVISATANHVVFPRDPGALFTDDGCAAFAESLREVARRTRAHNVLIWSDALMLPPPVDPATWTPEDAQRFAQMPFEEQARWLGARRVLVCTVETYFGDALLKCVYLPELQPMETSYEQREGVFANLLAPLKGAGDA